MPLAPLACQAPCQNRFRHGILATVPTKKKDPHAVALGRKGGIAAAGRGARARFEAMTENERRALAKKAALARWSRKGTD